MYPHRDIIIIPYGDRTEWRADGAFRDVTVCDSVITIRTLHTGFPETIIYIELMSNVHIKCVRDLFINRQ